MEDVIDDTSVEGDIIRGVYQDVVHIDGDVTFVDEVAENEVHHGLEGGWGVGEAEEHNHGLEETSIRFESCFPLIAIADAYVVISPSDIQLREECRSATVHSRESVH